MLPAPAARRPRAAPPEAYTAAMRDPHTPSAEHRWPVVIATLVAFVIYLVLPEQVQFLPAWVLPSVGVAAIIPLLIMNPHRLNRESTWSRWLSIGFALGLAVVNQIYVVLLIGHLVDGTVEGPPVLLTALAVWITNVIAYGIVYWELDAGGPVARRMQPARTTRRPDFRFPQQEHESDGWRPAFFDYVYFSLSNMMAFSPTDVMPLTRPAKAFMGVQALTGFVLLALVISRAVNILAPTAGG